MLLQLDACSSLSSGHDVAGRHIGGAGGGKSNRYGYDPSGLRLRESTVQGGVTY
ncbi:hypothetical protein GmRootV59_54320 (plasmid) [Variovorax sp. V59]|uniref:hypothetical protein n=1 Tax=unclassified Variovorax TaxID=663243 RepID=UPI0034E8CF87